MDVVHLTKNGIQEKNFGWGSDVTPNTDYEVLMIKVAPKGRLDATDVDGTRKMIMMNQKNI